MRSFGYVGACCALISCMNAPVGCAAPPGPSPGMPEAGSPEDCAAACVHLRALSCPEGNTTLGADGKPDSGDESTCEQTCIDVEASGYTSLNPRCVEQIATCADLVSCGWTSP